MTVTVRSFAKINLGLSIGPPRDDGYHDLRTVYQTIALHDVIRVSVTRGTGIEIRSADPRVPCDESNTCWRIVERAMAALQAKGRVVVEIEKRLPVQGGLGGGSANAVAALLALEYALKKPLPGAERLRIAAEVGSDLPLFLIGGTVLGVGRGEEVYPLADFGQMPCVIVTPEIAVSTPKAFSDWDELCGDGAMPRPSGAGPRRHTSLPHTGHSSNRTGEAPVPTRALPGRAKLTGSAASDRMAELGRRISAGLSGASGVPVSKGRGRAETLLLDLVRTGIENDFERVVFPKYPELREVKSVLEGAGALYASLSGSGSAMYGLFRSRPAAQRAAVRLRKQGIPVVVTATLTRRQYWKRLLAVSS
jgi:4-diphosphocytidyl-2-C-methyl-D-erythritol kinase